MMTRESRLMGGWARFVEVGIFAVALLGLIALLALAIADLGASPRYQSPWGPLTPRSQPPPAARGLPP